MKIHFVKQGETLESLSHRYDTTVESLREANPFLKDSNERLTAGMKLKIPSKTRKVKVSSLEPIIESNDPNDVFTQQEENLPVGSFYDMHAMPNEGPWGMPYPQMSAYVLQHAQQPKHHDPCGCQGANGYPMFGGAMPSMVSPYGAHPYGSPNMMPNMNLGGAMLNNMPNSMPNAMPNSMPMPIGTSDSMMNAMPNSALPQAMTPNSMMPSSVTPMSYSKYLPYSLSAQDAQQSKQSMTNLSDTDMMMEDDEIEWFDKKHRPRSKSKSSRKKKSATAKIKKLSKTKSSHTPRRDHSQPWINM